MSGHEFALIFTLRTPQVSRDDVLARLRAEGCADATVRVGRKGLLTLGFARNDGSASETVLRAITQVRRALPEAALIEASPDLVDITDVANLLHVSRQNVWKLLFESRVAAPPPVHSGRPSFWHLARLLEWLDETRGYHFRPELADLAHTTMQVNLAICAHDANRVAQREIAPLLKHRRRPALRQAPGEERAA